MQIVLCIGSNLKHFSLTADAVAAYNPMTVAVRFSMIFNLSVVEGHVLPLRFENLIF